jgi:hypothetical protein
VDQESKNPALGHNFGIDNLSSIEFAPKTAKITQTYDAISILLTHFTYTRLVGLKSRKKYEIIGCYAFLPKTPQNPQSQQQRPSIRNQATQPSSTIPPTVSATKQTISLLNSACDIQHTIYDIRVGFAPAATPKHDHNHPLSTPLHIYPSTGHESRATGDEYAPRRRRSKTAHLRKGVAKTYKKTGHFLKFLPKKRAFLANFCEFLGIFPRLFFKLAHLRRKLARLMRKSQAKSRKLARLR